MLGVVFLGQWTADVDQLHAHNAQAAPFKAADDLSGQSARIASGLANTRVRSRGSTGSSRVHGAATRCRRETVMFGSRKRTLPPPPRVRPSGSSVRGHATPLSPAAWGHFDAPELRCLFAAGFDPQVSRCGDAGRPHGLPALDPQGGEFAPSRGVDGNERRAFSFVPPRQGDSLERADPVGPAPCASASPSASRCQPDTRIRARPRDYQHRLQPTLGSQERRDRRQQELR